MYSLYISKQGRVDILYPYFFARFHVNLFLPCSQLFTFYIISRGKYQKICWPGEMPAWMKNISARKLRKSCGKLLFRRSPKYFPSSPTNAQAHTSRCGSFEPCRHMPLLSLQYMIDLGSSSGSFPRHDG